MSIYNLAMWIRQDFFPGWWKKVVGIIQPPYEAITCIFGLLYLVYPCYIPDIVGFFNHLLPEAEKPSLNSSMGPWGELQLFLDPEVSPASRRERQVMSTWCCIRPGCLKIVEREWHPRDGKEQVAVMILTSIYSVSSKFLRHIFTCSGQIRFDPTKLEATLHSRFSRIHRSPFHWRCPFSGQTWGKASCIRLLSRRGGFNDDFHLGPWGDDPIIPNLSMFQIFWHLVPPILMIL